MLHNNECHASCRASWNDSHQACTICLCRSELLAGPLYYVIVLLAATMLSWRTSPVGLVALAMMCGGDGLADVAGRNLHGPKLPYNPEKTVIGSAAMLSGTASNTLLSAAMCCAPYLCILHTPSHVCIPTCEHGPSGEDISCAALHPLLTGPSSA